MAPIRFFVLVGITGLLVVASGCGEEPSYVYSEDTGEEGGAEPGADENNDPDSGTTEPGAGPDLGVPVSETHYWKPLVVPEETQFLAISSIPYEENPAYLRGGTNSVVVI